MIALLVDVEDARSHCAICSPHGEEIKSIMTQYD